MKPNKTQYVPVAVIAAMLSTPLASAQPRWEGYYRFLGDHPNQEENYWSHEAQGIAHDDDHWYITQQGDLWKIPVENDLSDNSPGPGTLHIEIENTFPGASGYDHFGDFEYVENAGVGFLFIPITGPDRCEAVAVFRADNLDYVDHKCVEDGGAWSAFDPKGFLYFGFHSGLWRFTVNWPRLHNERTLELLNGTYIETMDEGGNFLEMPASQGGAFSPDGSLLYFTTGIPGSPAERHGITVFDTSTWRRVRKSTNGHGLFNFEFDPTKGLSDEEPEGLTVWDLDDGRAPGFRGQLHVILLDNDCGCECPPFGDCDDVFLKHYTSRLYVHRAYVGTERGTIEEPFKTVGEAVNFAWAGANLRVMGGIYPENITIDKQVRITSWNGATVRIGN